jgi:hypothetical protein
MTAAGLPSVRERYREFAVSVQHEAVVSEPIFGVDRWPERPVVAFNETHLRCSLRMYGRGRSQLCVLATAVAENTDDTVAFVLVSSDEVVFYVRCTDDERLSAACGEEEIETVTANGTWRVERTTARCRSIATYHHNRADVVEVFDSNQDSLVAFGDMHLTLHWTAGGGHTGLEPQGPVFSIPDDGGDEG